MKYNDEYMSLWQIANNHTNDAFTVPFWQQKNLQIGSCFANKLPVNFLHHPELLATMVSSNKDVALQQLDYLENIYNHEELHSIIRETDIGDPAIINEKYGASCNSIHHLYHITRWLESTGVDRHKIEKVVEWGGGYGRFCYTLIRMLPRLSSYTIIDLPAFSVLQYIYLRNLMPCRPKLHLERHFTLEEYNINLVPVGLVDHINIDVDLMIAMWSLGESSNMALDYVVKRNFFHAKHLMMATHNNIETTLPVGNRLLKTLVDRGCTVLPAEIAHEHYYAFS